MFKLLEVEFEDTKLLLMVGSGLEEEVVELVLDSLDSDTLCCHSYL